MVFNRVVITNPARVLLRTIIAGFASLGLIISACSPAPAGKLENFQASYLGTVININLFSQNAKAVADAIFKRIAEIDWKMSVQKPESELNAIARQAGISPVKVSDDTFFVINQGLEAAGKTGGIFDIAIGPIVKLWDITGEQPHVATDEELARLLPLVDYRNVELDAQAKTVFLKVSGMVVDVGGIAKGYAADEAARIAREMGVEKAILDLGGNIIVVGSRINGDPWRIGIQNPEMMRDQHLGIIRGVDVTAVSSGAYERFFVQDGITYHHILDPRTGKPSQSDLIQSTIFSKKSSMISDVLSTSTFVLGLEASRKLMESFPDYGAILVSKDHKIWISPSIREAFTPEDPQFELLP